MKIAITGGRDYSLTPLDWFWFGSWVHYYTDMVPTAPITFIHGDSFGVDQQVGQMLENLGYNVEKEAADWDKHGRAAGPIRNRAMAMSCDVLIAFPGRNGTDDMIRQCRKLERTIRESPTRRKP